MKCKVINSNKNNLEQRMTEWLITVEIEIINIVQTQENSYITLTILYNDIKEVRKLKLDKLNDT